jgi:O-acetyl-ADP-ribose deacetylase
LSGPWSHWWPRVRSRGARRPLLAACHVESLAEADRVGARSVAFPAVSCGVYGYPAEEAAPVAIDAVRSATTLVEQVGFVLFDDWTHAAWKAVLGG